MNIRPVRFAPWAAGARPRSSTRAPGSPKPGSGRPQYALAGEGGPLLARDLLAPGDEPRAAPAGRDPALELGEGGDPARRGLGGLGGGAGARGAPTSGPGAVERAEDEPDDDGLEVGQRAGALGAQAPADERARRPATTAKASSRVAKAGAPAGGPWRALSRCSPSANASRIGVAPGRRGRAGGRDLDEERPRRVGVRGQRLQEGARVAAARAPRRSRTGRGRRPGRAGP